MRLSVCLHSRGGGGGNHPDCQLTGTRTTWASNCRGAQVAGMQLGCSWDAIPPPPPAMGQG